MTTIAWDGYSIAADSLTTNEYGSKRLCTKIHEVGDGRIYAGAGVWSDVLVVARWLRETVWSETVTVIAQKPKLLDPKGSNGMLWVPKEKVMYTLESEHLVWAPVLEPFFAIGTGREYATAAMHLGKQAHVAVQIAVQFDAWSGGQIQTKQLLPRYATVTGDPRLEGER